MTPPPTMRMCLLMGSWGADSPAKRIALVENQRSCAVDEGGAADGRAECVVLDVHVPFEQAADDALLPPDISRREFSVLVKKRHLRALPDAACRPVARFAGI